jgi:hypothetical protein
MQAENTVRPAVLGLARPDLLTNAGAKTTYLGPYLLLWKPQPDHSKAIVFYQRLSCSTVGIVELLADASMQQCSFVYAQAQLQ